MSPGAPPADPHASFNKSRLFVISVLALATAGVSFSLRAAIEKDLRVDVLGKIDSRNAGTDTGIVLGVPFLGFAITIAIGSPLLDYLGMGTLLGLSSLCFICGTLVVVFAQHLSQGTGVYWILWLGMLIVGIGWGLVETVINPLAASLYTSDKTHKLNVLHAWWPGGIILGGLAGLALGYAHMSWQVTLAATILPALAFGLMVLGSKFPPTERVAAGIPASDMFREVLRPFFWVWFFAMFLTAASELAPGQWVNDALSRSLKMQGIWILVYISAIMFVMRHFAGPVAHKLSPVGLLWISSLLASLGLFLLSVANSNVTGVLAATAWGTGVCYMWPTMVATASERFPRGGALLMGLMGTAGTLSAFFVLPQMGKIYDHYKALGQELTMSGPMSFRAVAILPAVLLLVFGAIWLYDRSRGGYRPARITAAEELGAAETSEL